MAEITVVQGNVWIHGDIERMAMTLKKIGAGVICLQELTINFPGQRYSDTATYLANELDYDIHTSTPMGPTGRNWLQQNAILSSYELSDRKEAIINPTTDHGDFDDETRRYIESSITVNGKKLFIGTTHLSNTDEYINMTPRRVRELERLIPHIQNRSSYVLTGDFNAAPESCIVEEIEQHLQYAGPGYEVSTWTTRPGQHNDETMGLKWCIDYAFASSDVEIMQSESVHLPGSDHEGIKIKVKF